MPAGVEAIKRARSDQIRAERHDSLKDTSGPIDPLALVDTPCRRNGSNRWPTMLPLMSKASITLSGS